MIDWQDNYRTISGMMDESKEREKDSKSMCRAYIRACSPMLLLHVRVHGHVNSAIGSTRDNMPFHSNLDVAMLGITSEQTCINASKLACREYLTLVQKQELGRPRLGCIDDNIVNGVQQSSGTRLRSRNVALWSNCVYCESSNDIFQCIILPSTLTAPSDRSMRR